MDYLFSVEMMKRLTAKGICVFHIHLYGVVLWT